jgi:hypothetical protein
VGIRIAGEFYSPGLARKLRRETAALRRGEAVCYGKWSYRLEAGYLIRRHQWGGKREMSVGWDGRKPC